MKPVPALGIDFGTTTSTACLMAEGGVVFVTPDGDAQNSLMPSVVFFTGAGDKDYLVGLPATKSLTSTKDSRNVVQHIKREMAWDAEWNHLTPAEQKRFTFHSRSYRPAEIAGRIIRHLKLAAEKHVAGDAKLRDYFDFHGTINTAVVTVPAQFGSKERFSTREAALSYGGFHEVHLLEEPVAAALGLKLHQQPGRKIVMIVDLGGGTLDVTLLCVGKDAPNGGFLELGRIGDNELGGTDWDKIIAQHVVSSFCSQPKGRDRLIAEVQKLAANNGETPPAPNSVAFEAILDRLMQRTADIARNYMLHGQCERAKINLGDPGFRKPSVKVSYTDSLLGFVEADVTRDWFNQNTQLLSDWCAKRCEQLLGFVSHKQLRKVGLKKMTWKQVDQIVLVGGGSRLPAVHAAIAKLSGKNTKSEELKLAESAQHLVALGAAVYSEMRQNQTVLEGIGIPRSPRTFGVVNRVSHDNGRNGNGSLVKRLFGGSWFRHNGHQDENELREEFSPIIRISQAADEAVTVSYQLVNAASTEFRARIIEQRFTRHHPDGQLYHLWDLRIDNLPPPQPGFKDEVTITMRYGDDHQLAATAVCRGQTIAAELAEKSIQERGRPFELNAK